MNYTEAALYNTSTTIIIIWMLVRISFPWQVTYRLTHLKSACTMYIKFLSNRLNSGGSRRWHGKGKYTIIEITVAKY